MTNIIAKFAADDALGNRLPPEEHVIVSTFECEVEPYVLGVWVQGPNRDTKVIPLYLTQADLNEARKSWHDLLLKRQAEVK